MGITNIHIASQVLCRAGTEMTDQALIMPFDKAVLLIGRQFVQEEVDTFEEVLHTPYWDKWVEYNGIDTPKPTGNDKGLPVPSLYTSLGLREERMYRFDKPKSANGEPIELAFVIVVRGASAAKFSKVRVFYSYFAVAAGIMEEALQGLSVVFSAAMLKGDAKRLGQQGVSFVKVDDLATLIVAADKERASDSILLLC